MIKLELTPEQTETIVDALAFWQEELYAQFKPGNPEEESNTLDKICRAADLVKKIDATICLREHLKQRLYEFNTSVADAVGEGEQTKVDPFDFSGLEF